MQQLDGVVDSKPVNKNRSKKRNKSRRRWRWRWIYKKKKISLFINNVYSFIHQRFSKFLWKHMIKIKDLLKTIDYELINKGMWLLFQCVFLSLTSFIIY